MPREIRNWPDPCDPRMQHGGPCFAAPGFFNLYPAPWQFQVTLVGALAPFDIFNGTWLVPFFEFVPMFDNWKWRYELATDQYIEITKGFYDPPAPGGETHYYDIGFARLDLIPPRFPGAFWIAEYPKPWEDWPPVPISAVEPLIPNAPAVVPKRWDFTL